MIGTRRITRRSFLAAAGLAAVGASLSLTGCSGSVSDGLSSKHLLVAHSHSEAHPVNVGLQKMTEVASAESDLTFSVYPNGQLGDNAAMIQLVKAGVLDIAKVSASSMEQFNSAYAIFSMPYVFESTEQYFAVMNQSEAVQEIFKSTYDQGFFAIGWFDSGSTHFASMKKDQGFWPATVYLEGLDQYRGWFQSSLLTAVGALGKGAPFKECVTHGWTVDGEGKAMHKSLGNGMDPAEIFDKYGADLLRLWAGSSDYHVDVRCSDEIFKQLSQNYLKFRNTARYCLGNLDGFDANELVRPEDMQELDKWAITRLNKLIEKTFAAYDEYEFHVVSHLINDFCVVELSNFYLDIIKDRLYCSGRNSLERRSAQTALFLILDTLTKMFAPILAFTCDEIWLSMPHRAGDDARNVVLNEMNKPFVEYALDDSEMARWDALISVRNDVNGALEKARADKRIGKPLEASVTLRASGESKAVLDKVSDMNLKELLIVSECLIAEDDAADEAAVTASGSYNPGLTVSVREAAGTKCPRCWMHSVDADAETGLCPRCKAVLEAN